MISHLEFMVFGAMIMFFLIVEPHGLARLVVDREREAQAMAVPALMPLGVRGSWGIEAAKRRSEHIEEDDPKC